MAKEGEGEGGMGGKQAVIRQAEKISCTTWIKINLSLIYIWVPFFIWWRWRWMEPPVLSINSVSPLMNSKRGKGNSAGGEPVLGEHTRLLVTCLQFLFVSVHNVNLYKWHKMLPSLDVHVHKVTAPCGRQTDDLKTTRSHQPHPLPPSLVITVAQAPSISSKDVVFWPTIWNQTIFELHYSIKYSNVIQIYKNIQRQCKQMCGQISEKYYNLLWLLLLSLYCLSLHYLIGSGLAAHTKVWIWNCILLLLLFIG